MNGWVGIGGSKIRICDINLIVPTYNIFYGSYYLGKYIFMSDVPVYDILSANTLVQMCSKNVVLGGT